MAGPKTREPVMIAELRLTALGRSSLGTISTTKARRTGLSKAVMTPWIAASA